VTRRYVVFDIPPALYVSQWYLTRLFPGRKIFRFRRFHTFAAVREELAEADLAFLTPSQLALFPDEYFDAFVSISTLPEMTMAQIENYISLMSRVTRRTIYLKQWRAWRNEKDGFTFTYDKVRMPSHWLLQLDSTDRVQPLFQERVWTHSSFA
jgi:hypothetical protein